MALSADSTLFISDSGGDRILKVDLRSQRVESWLDCKKTDLASTRAVPNGLKVHDGWVYFSRGRHPQG